MALWQNLIRRKVLSCTSEIFWEGLANMQCMKDWPLRGGWWRRRWRLSGSRSTWTQHSLLRKSPVVLGESFSGVSSADAQPQPHRVIELAGRVCTWRQTVAETPLQTTAAGRASICNQTNTLALRSLYSHVHNKKDTNNYDMYDREEHKQVIIQAYMLIRKFPVSTLVSDGWRGERRAV